MASYSSVADPMWCVCRWMKFGGDRRVKKDLSLQSLGIVKHIDIMTQFIKEFATNFARPDSELLVSDGSAKRLVLSGSPGYSGNTKSFSG